LRAELLLAPAPPEVTRKRYYMANEAAVRALEEHWRDPARGDRGGAGRLCGDAARAGAAVAASG
ncbi:MAG: hypothetical protein ABI193_07220, partial [Minicystis sp.]